MVKVIPEKHQRKREMVHIPNRYYFILNFKLLDMNVNYE